MSAMTHAHLTPQCTTHSTLPNKFIIRVIRCNRGQLIYFKTPRKCAIFGIMCEAIPQQVNYLIDEASSSANQEQKNWLHQTAITTVGSSKPQPFLAQGCLFGRHTLIGGFESTHLPQMPLVEIFAPVMLRKLVLQRQDRFSH